MLKTDQIFTCILVFFTALSSSIAIAQDGSQDWFQIEYVIFEYLDSDRSVLRYEDVKYEPPQERQYQYIYPFGETLSPYQQKPITPDLSDLQVAIQNLERSSEVRVTNKGAWQQRIEKESAALPLKIADGTSYYNERYQLEGSLQVRRSRYMHVDIDVFLAEFDTVPYRDTKNWFFEYDDERWPIQWLVLPLAYEHPVLQEPGQGYIENNIIHLKQSRRIKDAEVHYIDHPALGMVVTIKKIEDPFALEDEYEDAN